MASRTSLNLGVRDQLVHESIAMAQYALAAGKQITSATAATLEQARAAPADTTSDIAAITRVHDQLAKLVAPATPRALLLMGEEHGTRGGLRAMLGPVGLVRRMMVAAIASMAVFIGVSLTPYVNESLTVQNSSGLELLATELFWLSAAAMGASFAMLMQVSSYVVKRNYDPRYEPSYWIKFFLGVMAGFILVALVPFDAGRAGGGGGALSLAQPTFAMLGGFSASAVFRILTRLVEAVESVFRGDVKDEIARRENEALSKANEETSQIRMGLAAQVVQLQQEVSSGADAAALTTRLREILATLMPGTPTDASAASAAADTPPEPAAATAGADAEAEGAPEKTIALPNVPVVAG